MPLSRAADIGVVEGPSTVTREWGERRAVVACNVRGRDLGGFVAEARRRAAADVALPPGRYRLAYGGRLEQVAEAGPQPGGGHDHSGRWCDDHGVKEECGMCGPKVAEAFRSKGDWCRHRNRAKSQCSVCAPRLRDKSGAEYKAEYGTGPPDPDGRKPAPAGPVSPCP